MILGSLFKPLPEIGNLEQYSVLLYCFFSSKTSLIPPPYLDAAQFSFGLLVCHFVMKTCISLLLPACCNTCFPLNSSSSYWSFFAIKSVGFCCNVIIVVLEKTLGKERGRALTSCLSPSPELLIAEQTETLPTIQG